MWAQLTHPKSPPLTSAPGSPQCVGVQVPKFCTSVAEVRGNIISAHPAFSRGAQCMSARWGVPTALRRTRPGSTRENSGPRGKGIILTAHSVCTGLPTRVYAQPPAFRPGDRALGVKCREDLALWDGGGHLSVCDHPEQGLRLTPENSGIT